MKLIILLLTTTILQVSANTYGQNVTIRQSNSTLINVFKEIRKQTGYDFFYSDRMMEQANTVSLNLSNASLKEALELCFKNQPLSYSIENKTVTVKEKEKSVFNKISDYFAEIDISGRIVDEAGMPLPGATIMIKRGKLSVAVITDKNGRFIFRNVDSNDLLTISYLGYQSKEVKASANLQNIVLELSDSKLDEVQIQAYGTTSKRMSTGNITSVKAEEIAKQPVGNILLALQGKIPGMSIVQTTGMAGAAPTVKIRGTNSIGATLNPLYILDGVPVPDTQNAINGSNFQQISALEGINPADIESVDVLKDADATAIYGSRGANGVILITTKKGRAGKAQVNFNAYSGFAKVQHFVDMMDVHEYNSMRREALKNDGIVPTVANSPDLFSYDTVNVHNWQKELIGGTAITNDANVSISGGGGGTTIYANAGYHKQGTVFPGDANDIRKSVRLNINHISPNGKLTLGLISGYNISTLNLQGLDLTSSIGMAPSYSLYTAAGTPNYSGANGYPLAYTLQPFHTETSTYNGHASLAYEFITGLKLKLDAGFNNSVNDQYSKRPLISLDPTTNTSGALSTANYENNTWIVEPQLTYHKKLNKHSFDFLVGTTFQKTNGNSITGQGSNFPNEALLGNLSSAGTVTVNTSTGNGYTYTSLFSRLSYSYQEKYLANATFRRDGSSKFGPNKRFGNFGALGLGWIFSKEHAVTEALPFLSYGKIRTSYGVNGNDGIGSYQYVSVYNSSSNGYQGATLSSSNVPNPDFRWEQNRKFEAALDLGFFKDRILLSTSFFRNRTDNQLVNYALSPQTGFAGYTTNFPALLQNQGWEFELNTTNIRAADFSWKTALNIAFSKNKLVSWPGIEKTSYATTYEVGQSITLSRGYVFNGLSNTGLPTYKDLNGDGSISATDDRIILGTKDPITGGLSNEFSYKNFDLSFFIDYAQFNGYDPAVLAVRSGSIGANRTAQVLGRWQKPGDELITNIPRYTTSSSAYVPRNYLQTDLNWMRADVFRLRNVTFSYKLPYNFIRKLSLQNAKVFFLGQNLWTSGDKDTLLDPETGYSTLPPLRTLTFGINFTF